MGRWSSSGFLSFVLVFTACQVRGMEDVVVPTQQWIADPADRAFGGAEGDFETQWFASKIPFDELIASWNVSGEPFVVEVRVAPDSEGATRAPSPWLEIGTFGAVDRTRERVIEFTGGKIDVDVFVATTGQRFGAAQLRFRSPVSCRLARCDIGFTTRGEPRPLPAPSNHAGDSCEIAIPFLSQRTAPEAIRGRICSPTSLAMVLRYFGRDVSPEGIAAEVFDSEHDLYGIWPRNVQVAFRHGVPGAVRRFASWDEVEATLRRGTPIIASIGVEKGQLTGAPYETTAGHLIVLRGIDARGDILVNDPAAATPQAGQLTYRRDQLAVCWLARGGTAYLLGDEIGGNDAQSGSR